MSTRAVIAEPQGDLWRGRYHHWDGYPSALGATLWEKVHTLGVVHVRTFLLEQHTGWSTVNDKDWSLPAGYGGDPGSKREQPECYCHGTRREKGFWLTRTSKDDAGVEWAYVLGDNAITVEKRDYKTGSWLTVETIPWSAPEPDWEKMDEWEPQS